MSGSAILAAILFAIAFILHVFSISHGAVNDVSFALAGLVFVALALVPVLQLRRGPRNTV